MNQRTSVPACVDEDYDDDNMRGWDPASEDDSKYNGMDRWSENNDEKGWW